MRKGSLGFKASASRFHTHVLTSFHVIKFGGPVRVNVEMGKCPIIDERRANVRDAVLHSSVAVSRSHTEGSAYAPCCVVSSALALKCVFFSPSSPLVWLRALMAEVRRRWPRITGEPGPVELRTDCTELRFTGTGMNETDWDRLWPGVAAVSVAAVSSMVGWERGV